MRSVSICAASPAYSPAANSSRTRGLTSSGANSSASRTTMSPPVPSAHIMPISAWSSRYAHAADSGAGSTPACRASSRNAGEAKLCSIRSRRDASNVAGMTTSLMSRPHRSYFSSRGGLRSVSSARSAIGPPISAPSCSRCGVGPRQPVGAEVLAHHELQRRIRRVPVAPDGADVALGGVAAGLGLRSEREVVDGIAEVGRHGPMLRRRLGGGVSDPAASSRRHRPLGSSPGRRRRAGARVDVGSPNGSTRTVRS